MQALAQSPIEPWDYLYYSERLRQSKSGVDVAALAPYFELNRMLEAALWSAEQRYGIKLREITGAVP